MSWRSLFPLLVWGTLLLFPVEGSGRKRADPDLAATFAPRSPARLLHVVDGDTAYLTLEDGRVVKGRLAGINAPECHKEQVRAGRRRSARCVRDDELGGLEAYRALRKLLERGPLSLDCERTRAGDCRRDRSGRVLITVRAADHDAAEHLVRAGLAFTFTKYPSPSRARLCAAEAEARARRGGLWARGTVGEVLAMMSPRTRAWYAHHDRLCAAAQARRP